MAEVMIKGVPVSFPFEPYDVQKAYMEKVIECLQNGYNGVLESPTGTGKTLSLLCSSLGWLLVKKAQIQVNAQMGIFENQGSFMNSLENKLKNVAGKQSESNSWGMPKIIYASRTHSQLSQAMQELKRSNYRHVKASILGSRDQMCIHPEVSKELNNNNKVALCQARVKTKTCYFHNNVESKKEDAKFKNTILDIEDLVKVSKTLKCCPYYVAKDLKQSADIIFLPYNYLLDPKSRKANGIELANNVIILDEAHNIEKMCEESASLQIRSTEIALCIEEITHIMKHITESQDEGTEFAINETPNSQKQDFTPDDLCTLKSIFLTLEKVIDDIPVSVGDGVTFSGDYIFDILGKAQVTDSNSHIVTALIENLIQFLTTGSGTSPFQRKGNGLQKFADLLNICFSDSKIVNKERVMKCYKVHIHLEEKKKKADSWSVIKSGNTNSHERVISYWCFSPGFGMKQLMEQNIRCVILTSGTLAPLNPLITELAIPIQVRLENPHIVNSNQIFVKIIGQGPDNEPLNSNFNNRNNPKYISSLGRTILSICKVVPDGVLVFFPSYPILSKCQQDWQLEGIWANISDIKPIFVEPQRKDTFNSTISDFYSKINEIEGKGACFMAVCRGKVSEGLDFADMNGRAVIITGLPFPPLKDPRIILKKKYLEEQRSKDKEFLSGDEWYSLEASRAVNQAIGRVIRHKNDYGAILLCDSRFNSPRLKMQLSSWVRSRLSVCNRFGEMIGELCRFFKNAERTLPSPRLKPLKESEIGGISISTKDVLASMKSNIRMIPKKENIKCVSYLPKSNEALIGMDYYKKMQNSVTSSQNSVRKTSDLFQALDAYSDVTEVNIASGGQRQLASNNILSSESAELKTKKKLKILPFGFDQNIEASNIICESSSKHVDPSDVSCESKHDKSDENKTATIKKAPKDLSEFVKCVKTFLDKQSYKQFQLCISSYKSNNSYVEFINILDRLFFHNKNTHYLLYEMGRFLKDEHKKLFEIYKLKLSN